MASKLRLFVLFTLSLVLLCGVVWAALELSGQSNKTAADAGSSAADMEMASLDSIKPSTKAPAASQSKDEALRGKIKSADKKYQATLSKAKSEIDGKGEVSEPTRKKGMGEARTYRDANEEYAKYWDSQNLPSRAKLAREVGASRMASAEMAFNEIDSDKINAYNRQQDSMRQAQSEYLKDAKQDTSEQDRAAIKSGMNASLDKVGGDLSSLLSTATSLLSQVQRQVGGVSNFSAGGCARQVAANPTALTSPVEGVANLLQPLQALTSLLSNMSSNVDSLRADVNAL